MTLKGLSPEEKTRLFEALGQEEYFRVVRRDARINDEAAVEAEIRMRSSMRLEQRDHDEARDSGWLTSLSKRWSGR